MLPQKQARGIVINEEVVASGANGKNLPPKEASKGKSAHRWDIEAQLWQWRRVILILGLHSLSPGITSYYKTDEQSFFLKLFILSLGLRSRPSYTDGGSSTTSSRSSPVIKQVKGRWIEDHIGRELIVFNGVVDRYPVVLDTLCCL